MFNSAWTIGRIIKYASAGIIGISLVVLAFNAIRKNDEGYRQVRMNPLTGNLTVREKAGLYINGIYQVKTYQWDYICRQKCKVFVINALYFFNLK